MEKNYSPADVEPRIYAQWMEHGHFHADVASDKPSYSIVIPPPNVTGVLHMGHALNNTIQDVLVRYKRMKQFEALWMPGTDHAGIATQNVVERALKKENATRYSLGRRAFIERVWEWKHTHHHTITNQLKKLGASCDWQRERFTMDEGLSRAVRHVFVTLYNDGLVYKGNYIINWCPRCETALSDEESEHREVRGKLYHFRYPYADGSGHVTVATTRPETMLGDTAVAVNPADERYASLIGKTLVLPIAEREIPVIADDFVDMTFGTGAVKVTPAHDPNDFAMGKRHDMAPVVVMDEKARMHGEVPQAYQGLDRYAAREKIVEDMDARGLLASVQSHDHAVGHCYRCDTEVEPYLSEQWFVKMKPLAHKALQAAYTDEIRFYPARWKKIYIAWLENIRDWCISRQIWWGHRIPVWYCSDCHAMIVAEETPQRCTTCGSEHLQQDEDVLDTWFSSWLWPFSTMGWPDHTPELATFYPTDALVTASEILFFWVARMIMAGEYFTGTLPFRDIIIHGTVRDTSGKKMSKSLGNAIDPIGIIEEHGADALRFSILMITAQGADVYLDTHTFDIGRNFANKIWNATRFILGACKEQHYTFETVPGDDGQSRAAMDAADRWVLSRLFSTVARLERALQEYRLNEACHQLYDFTWRDFCDWYIEIKKSAMYSDDPQIHRHAVAMLMYVLSHIVRMLHPFMPFITEHLWQYLQEKVSWPHMVDAPWCIQASFPRPQQEWVDAGLEERFELLQKIITALRTIRAENNVPPGKKGSAVIVPADEQTLQWLRMHTDMINRFAAMNETVVDMQAQRPRLCGESVVYGTQVFVSLEGLIDVDVELTRLRKEYEKTAALITAAEKKLHNEKFLANAPQEVVQKEREKYEGLTAHREKLTGSIARLEDAAAQDPAVGKTHEGRTEDTDRETDV
jgi:valyl-tRNA synthetase